MIPDAAIDLFAKLSDFLNSTGYLGLISSITFFLAYVYLVLKNKRNVLIYLFLITTVFSGFIAVPSLDSGSMVVRWLTVLALASTAIYGYRSPGVPAVLLAIVGAIAGVTSLVGPFWQITVQRSLLMVVFYGPMAAVISKEFQTESELRKMFSYFIVPASIFGIMGLLFIGTLEEGTRYGGGQSASMFAMTGGLLLPICVWNSFYNVKRYLRIWSLIISLLVLSLLIVSSQRTGTYAGILGCIPIIAKMKIRRFIYIAFCAIALFIVSQYVQKSIPRQVDFIEMRFTSVNLSSRDVIWDAAWQVTMESPWVGKGIGASAFALRGKYFSEFGTIDFGFHNAYLSSLYDSGIVGFGIVIIAYIWLIIGSIKGAVLGIDEHSREIGILLLGICVTAFASGVVEDTIFGASNLGVFLLSIISISIRVVKTKKLKMSREKDFRESAVRFESQDNIS